MALETLGRPEEARQALQQGLTVGCLHHAAEPGRVGAMWRQARQADRNMENDMNRLMAALPPQNAGGAMICSFETFGQIYRMQRGIQAQYLVPVFLLLVTMVPVQARDDAETERMMQVLQELLRSCLRSCDVAARYSERSARLCWSAARRGRTPPCWSASSRPSTARPATSGICSTTTPTPPNRGRNRRAAGAAIPAKKPEQNSPRRYCPAGAVRV